MERAYRPWEEVKAGIRNYLKLNWLHNANNSSRVISRYIYIINIFNLKNFMFFITHLIFIFITYSVQFSHSVVSDSLWPHESQHVRPPCPSWTPRVHSNSHPSSWWCYPAISSSVIPFSALPQSLPASECFPMSQHFVWGGQSTGVSALTSFLPNNTQDWSPLEWTGWISSQSKGLLRVFSNTTVQNHQLFHV